MSSSLKKKLSNLGAIIENDHFIYTSGKHGSAYVNKDAIYPHTKLTSDICKQLAEKSKKFRPDVIVGPVAGGVVLSQWTAHHLSKLLKKEVLSVYADKTLDGGLVLKRGYEKLVRGKRVLIVDDIINAGMSIKGVIKAIRKEKGNIVGVAVICTRWHITDSFGGIPIVSLLHIPLDIWPAKNCTLCKKEVPINKMFGKGKELI